MYAFCNSIYCLLTGSIVIGSLVALVELACDGVRFYFHEKSWIYFQCKKQQQLRRSHEVIST